MRNGSVLAKLRDAIMGPPPPQHLRQRVVIPFYVRAWNFIRPPKSRGRPLGLNRSQSRLVGIALTVAAILSVSGGLYFYLFSGLEERSMAALQEGLKSVAKVDYKGSVDQFTGAISIWPNNALAYLHRGNSRAVLGETAQAKRDWDRATQLDPDLAEPYTARGTQLRIEGHAQKAANELSRSIQLQPSVDAYYQRGQIYVTLREYQKAIEDFDRSIAEQRGAPYVYRARAAARRAIGDLAGAAEDRATADRIEGVRSEAFSVR
jgi:tetratricopeptide (TPR) repeat protein